MPALHQVSAKRPWRASQNRTQASADGCRSETMNSCVVRMASIRVTDAQRSACRTRQSYPACSRAC
eukprot:7816648-Alexandrium_andersonii.AAC.1